MAPEAQREPVLSVRNLSLEYAPRTQFGRKRASVSALDRISLDLFAGKTLALVGPSGSGKSSLARCLVLLEQPSSGEILYRGQNLLAQDRSELKRVRREIHLVFQDSASALNPGLSVEEIISEPLMIHEPSQPRAERLRRIREVAAQIELPEQWLAKKPLELSGGQRQRVAIARALILQPRILVLDEALASLDLSAQAQIANLLLAVQETRSLAYAFITHDISMAARLAHQVAVLQSGRIVQRGAPIEVFTTPLHREDASLLSGSRSGETVSVP